MKMKLGVSFPSATDFRAVLADIANLEQAGAEAVWVGESYGHDAVSALGAMAALTQRIELGFGVLPVQTRTPALIAMTAAGVDALSGGRAILGLGASGPQVVEGWHDVPFGAPLERTREVVATCRRVWSQQRATPSRVAADGQAYRGLRLMNPPVRTKIPIFVAASGQRNVALAAEIADGWLPAFLWPERMQEVWGSVLAEGAARRQEGLAPLEITTGVYFAVGESAGEAARAHRQRLARYIGGMGTRKTNFFARLAGGYGFHREAEQIQQLYLAGHTSEAERAVPDELVWATSVIGDSSTVARRLRAFHEAGVTTLNVSLAGATSADRVGQLRACRAAIDALLSPRAPSSGSGDGARPSSGPTPAAPRERLVQ
jgi:F420-dependent oxidoreductase-like protein